MIKIRLHGLPQEVSRFSKVLQEMARVGVIKIHTQSENYADRGESSYVRRYFEMDQLVDVDVALDPPGQALPPKRRRG